MEEQLNLTSTKESTQTPQTTKELEELNNNNIINSTTTNSDSNNININNNTIDSNINNNNIKNNTFKSSLTSFLSSYTPTTKIDSNLLTHFKSSLSLITSPISSIAYPISSGFSVVSNIPLISYITNSIPFPISYRSSPTTTTTTTTSSPTLSTTITQPINVNNNNNNTNNNMVTQHQQHSPTTSILGNTMNSFSSFSQRTNQSILNNTNNTSNSFGTEEQYNEILNRLEQSEFNYQLISLNSFIENMNNDSQSQTVQDISMSVKSFITTTLPMVLHACASIPFKSPSSTIQSRSPCIPSLVGKSMVELETITYEFIEQYITSRLYRRIFSSQEGIQKDTALCEHISKFQFITPSNLDINDSMISNQFLEQIQEELLRMTAYKSPRDKLICIKKSFETLFKLLSKSSTPIGADLLLPIIIYCLIKSNLPFLYSNLQYISLFRNPNFIEAETNYYLVTLITATSFIQDMTFESLTNAVDPSKEVSATETVATVTTNESSNNTPTLAVVDDESTHQHEDIKPTSSSLTSITPTPKLNVKKQPTNNLETILEPQDKTIEIKQKQWKYYHSSSDELSIKDVKKLLLDFNQLVDFWYEHQKNDDNNNNNVSNSTK